jgi:hypothetical protein
MNQEIPTKEYRLSDILGIITGYVLRDGGIDGIHSLIEWMANGPVFTHQIPKVAPHCERALKKQFSQLNLDEKPFLAERLSLFVRALQNRERIQAVLIWGGLVAEYGDSFQVAQMQPSDFEMPSLLDGLDKSKTIIIATA